ncbi:Carboxypeptidase regulatory-like domain-containing protein [Pseudonocardia ammonioxydans]|uniref:Carboxypeptidase regulatory-like domain-containing protein n=1 Tax=Pseudonocardia ammonioxydans TaxID=260086 RepID=A0A1I4TVG5_PSUAM|nr:carboxypeptidase regulatory-like domain-containing protein [Pseudonocardia ammonioxydans]SFM80575.1 Carboxypeptidase regulatory-like domain-containing protein [Pseudonocardia ammonioxydans]
MADVDERPGRGRTAKDLALALWFPAFFVLGFMLFYLLPFHAPAPHDIPVAVVGEQAAVAVGDELATAVPGGFDVTSIAAADDIRQAVFERDVVAGYDPGTHTLFVAKADGMQLVQILQGIFAPLSTAGGAPLQVVDLAPTAPGDGFGTSLFYIAMAWNISGYIAVMMMMQAVTLSRRTKLLALAGFGAGAAVVCWVIGTSISAIPFHPAVLLVGFLLSQAVAWTTYGMAPFVRRALPGVAMGMFVLLSIPSSGGAIPKEMVPGFFQALHHVMPLGQAVDAARGILYFEGTAVTGPILGLLAWWAFGAVLVALGARRERRAADTAPAEDSGQESEQELERRIAEAVADEAAVGGAHPDSLADARLLAHPVPTLIGRITDARGCPVPRARVTVVDGAGAQVDVAAGSEDGRFAVRGRDGEWVTVLVSAPGFDPVSQRLRLDSPVAHRSFLLGVPPERAGARAPVPASTA